jgi:RsiW-degrading membrane proteinase PrsW (M82 family)
VPSAVRSAFRAILLLGLVLAMLASGLIVLAIAGLETGPAAFGLAVVLALLPVPVYLALVLFIDRYEPEPLRMIVLTFLWGATIAAFVAIVLNTAGEALVSEELGSDVGELYGYSISAPIVEEGAKGLALFGIYRFFRREFNGVIDGIVYAALVGLGFAMTENVLYYGRGAAEEGIVGAVSTFVVRGLMSPFAHPVFTAMTGIGLGIAVSTRSRTLRTVAPLLGLGAAMALHSLWNTSAGSGLFLGVYLLIMVPIFVLIAVIVVVALRREARVIRSYLRGTLPDAEIAALASLQGRRRWRREAKRRGGRRARRAMADLQHGAAELAFLRQQVDRGVIHRDARAAAKEEQLLAQVVRRRGELTALTG